MWAPTRNPSGSRTTASPWLIHTCSVAFMSASSTPGAVHRQRRAAVLALTGRGHLSAERLRHQLVPVADAEHGYPEVEHARIQARRALLVHRRRAARQDDAGGTHPAELADREVVRDDLGVDVALADPARDQLRVLRPEVDDQDGARVVVRRGVSQWPIPTRCCVWYILPSVLIDGAITSSAFWNSFTFA